MRRIGGCCGELGGGSWRVYARGTVRRREELENARMEVDVRAETRAGLRNAIVEVDLEFARARLRCLCCCETEASMYRLVVIVSTSQSDSWPSGLLELAGRVIHLGEMAKQLWKVVPGKNSSGCENIGDEVGAH